MLLATATAGSASSFVSGGTGNEDITDFGGDRYRKHLSSEPWGYPMCSAWAVDLGRSASQPLHVGDRIYHLAGDSLWALRRVDSLPPDLTNEEIQERLVIWRRRDLQTDISFSHPTYVDQTVRTRDGRTYRGVIYAGTGPMPNQDGAPTASSLIAVAAEDGTLLGRMPLPDKIVSAPLAFADSDTVVFGTVNGWVWSVRGLASSPVSGVQWFWRPLGGRVSSSPVPLGPDSFLIGADGSDGQGKVMAYDLTARPLWLTDAGEPDFVQTPYGVAASFAKAGDIAYFADKEGIFYGLDVNTGQLLWNKTVAGVVNNSPAVDDEKVYFTMRQAFSDGKGHLLAFDRINGSLQWDSVLPAAGNTAPMIWGNAGAVLVGDTSGKISAWTTTAGSPQPFAVDLSCRDAGHLRTFWQRIGGTGWEMLKPEITLTNSPYRDDIGWSQASGAGTELSLTKGMLLAGANGAKQDVLMAFRHGGQVNLGLDGYLVESGPYEPGQQLTAKMHIVNDSKEPRRQVIVHGWGNAEPWFQFIDVEPWDDFWITVTTPPIPDSESATYSAVINPWFYDFARREGHWLGENLTPLPAAWEPVLYGLTPLSPSAQAGLDRMDAVGDAVIYELNATDNIWHYDVLTKPPINLTMNWLWAPATIPAPEPPAHPQFWVTAAINNGSDRTIDTTIRYVIDSQAVSGGQIEISVTLPPGLSRHSAAIPGSISGDTIRVTATVNPDRSTAETSHADNSDWAETIVEDVEPIDPGDGWGKVDDILLK